MKRDYKFKSPCYECPRIKETFCIVSCKKFNDYMGRIEKQEKYSWSRFKEKYNQMDKD